MTHFESFSEDLIPRILPQPTLHPVLDLSKPTVPEVSLIFDDSKQMILNNDSQPQSYKVWKQQQHQQQHQQQQKHVQQQQQQNLDPNKIQLSDRRKIVTFDLPTEEQHPDMKTMPQMVETSPIALCHQLDLSLYEPLNNNNGNRHSVPANYTPPEMQCKQQEYNGHTPYRNENGIKMSMPQIAKVNNMGGTLNNQMAMQNLTNPLINNTNCNATNQITLNEIYQLLQNIQVSNQSSSSNQMKNHKTNDIGQFDNTTDGLERHQQISHFTSVPNRFDASANVPHSVNGDPSVRDIFNVILKQQEQLMNLQSQVQLLLMHSTANVQMHQQDERSQYVNRISHTNSNVNEIDRHKKQMGVVTSLEINVKNSKSNDIQTTANFNTPENPKRIMGNQNIKQCGCICNCTERKAVQSSDSGSNDENLDASPDRGETQTGWTFYGNILNQVNNVLQSTPPATNAQPDDSNSPNIENLYSSPNNVQSVRSNGVMPKQIRTAQFKQVGFQIDDVNISAMSKRITFGSPTSDTPRTSAHRIKPNDNSVLINALAMKYLPCELTNTPPQKAIQNATVQMTTPTETYTTAAEMTPTASGNCLLTKRQNELDGKHLNTDMSITSYRYMEKYGLL